MVSQPISARPPASPWRKPGLVFLVAYFVYFSWDSIRVRFAPDDFMNLAYYWRTEPAQLILWQFMPWRGFNRPMAGFFYATLLSLFGLNPAVYHLVILLLLLAGVYLLYRLARLLGSDELVAGLAALLVCYQPGLSDLHFNIAYIFDILCWSFYLGALVYYVRIRRLRQALNLLQTALFLALYLCALNSKEMAVTLPVMLLAYEWIYHKPGITGIPAHFFGGPGRTVLIAGLLNLPYLYGRLLGPDRMILNPAYRPDLSLSRFVESQAQFFADLAGYWQFFGWRSILAIWVVLTWLAWRRDHPVLRFCWTWILITALPVEFLSGRIGASFIIPASGMAIFVSSVFAGAARALASFLAERTPLRRLAPQTLLAAICLSCVLALAFRNHSIKQGRVRLAMDNLGRDTGTVLEQFRSLNPRVRPNSTVVILKDPFEDYDMALIAELWFRDRSVNIKLFRKTPLTPEELAKADHLLTYDNGRLIQLR